MSSAFFALVCTVVLLVATAYFLMGGLPLLILQHDTPVDGKFIRRFFEVYYLAAFFPEIGACLSYAAWGRIYFSAVAALIAVLVFVLRRTVIPAMNRLEGGILDGDPSALAAFRRVHATALLLNLAQLAVLVWGLVQLSR